MLVYRIARGIYARDLMGMGAGLYGGRWNPPGINLLYTAGSISLACLEYLVHNFHTLRSSDICLVKISIRNEPSIREVSLSELPTDWQEKSYIPLATQKIGERFVREALAHILKVPSAIVPDEYNYLFNPLHPDHSNLEIEGVIDPFEIDERLFRT